VAGYVLCSVMDIVPSVWLSTLWDNIHNFVKTGNGKHFENFFGCVRDGKTLLLEILMMNEAYSQKEGGNEKHSAHVEDDSGVCVVCFEFSGTLYQFLFQRRTHESIQTFGK